MARAAHHTSQTAPSVLEACAACLCATRRGVCPEDPQLRILHACTRMKFLGRHASHMGTALDSLCVHSGHANIGTATRAGAKPHVLCVQLKYHMALMVWRIRVGMWENPPYLNKKKERVPDCWHGIGNQRDIFVKPEAIDSNGYWKH